MPTLSEIATLVEVAEREDPILAVAIQLAARTGMRRGELCGLRWRDLDTDRLVLTVETAAKHIPSRTYIAETKTHRSRRFSVDQATVDLLKAHRAVMATIGRGGDDDFLFTWSSRNAANPDLMTGRFIAIRGTCSYLRSPKFHTLVKQAHGGCCSGNVLETYGLREVVQEHDGLRDSAGSVGRLPEKSAMFSQLAKRSGKQEDRRGAVRPSHTRTEWTV